MSRINVHIQRTFWSNLHPIEQEGNNFLKDIVCLLVLEMIFMSDTQKTVVLYFIALFNREARGMAVTGQ